MRGSVSRGGSVVSAEILAILQGASGAAPDRAARTSQSEKRKTQKSKVNPRGSGERSASNFSPPTASVTFPCAHLFFQGRSYQGQLTRAARLLNVKDGGFGFHLPFGRGLPLGRLRRASVRRTSPPIPRGRRGDHPLPSAPACFRRREAPRWAMRFQVGRPRKWASRRQNLPGSSSPCDGNRKGRDGRATCAGFEGVSTCQFEASQHAPGTCWKEWGERALRTRRASRKWTVGRCPKMVARGC